MRSLIRVCIICSLLVMGLDSFAQQPSHYSQYVFNNYLLNPAAGGVGDYIDIKGGYRNQWIGFGAAPQTYLVSLHAPISNLKLEPKPFGTRNHHAFGGYVVKDQTGPISQLGGYISYAYHIRISYNLKVSAGVSAGFRQYSLNTDELWTLEANDQDLISMKTSTPDATAGIWVYTDKYFAGFSGHQLIPLKLSTSDNKLNMHYFLTGGYSFPLRKLDSYLVPSANVRFGILTPIQTDITVKLKYKRVAWAGISYRKIDGLIGIVGVNVYNYLQIGYAYDFTLSKLAKYSNNSHEIIIGLRFKPSKNKTQVRCPDWG